MLAIMFISAAALPLGILGAMLTQSSNAWIREHVIHIVFALLVLPALAAAIYTAVYHLL